ncbi:hypothetical protein [Haloterrigena salifodinae]|uniref:hypothetical protein n=1 Tax=Haloterrigena salifodinae TaxID=2675099 RepID=UPI000F8655DF|nr:hypothetical protein [Haloterrigena salifodinae]
MTDGKTTEELWQERLTEARVQVGRGLKPERLAGRYDAESADAIAALTKRGTQQMLNSRYGTLTLDDQDEAAEIMGIEIREPVTDGGRDVKSTSGTCRRGECDWPVEFDGGDQCILHAAEDWARSRDTGTERPGGDSA